MVYFIIFLSVLLLFYFFKKIESGKVTLILPAFYSFVIVYVLLGTFYFSYAKETPFDLYYFIDSDDVLNASLTFMFALIAFTMGSLIVKTKPFVDNKNPLNIKRQNVLFFGVIILHVIYIFGYGVDSLVTRRGYIDIVNERNMTILKIFFVLSPFFITSIALIDSRYKRYFLYAFSYLVLFSASSRFVVMVPFLYLVGSYLKYKRFNFYSIILNVIILIFSLVFILQIRNNINHGLLPNIAFLIEKGIDTDFLFKGVNYAFSFSIYGTAFVLKNFSHDIDAFLISISPLPSSFHNMDKMLEAQRMIGTSPMSAISALSLAGTEILLSFYFISGFIFTYILEKLKNQGYVYFIVLGLFVLFTLFSIQYNLRGLTRFLYYSIVIFLIYFTTKWFLKQVKYK